MRWSKIKNIIILLLAAVNICLLGMVGMRTVNTMQLERETCRQMIAVLEDSGVEFLAPELPGAMELTGLVLEPRMPDEEQAALVVGEIRDSIHTEGAVSYVGSRGGITFTGSSVDVRLLPDAMALEGRDAGDYGKALLKELKLEFTELRRRQVSGGVELTYIQLWDGVPVPDMALELTFTEGSLRRISGRWLLADPLPQELPRQPAMDGPTALARFLEARNREGYVCAQVRDMYAGYLPVWEDGLSLRPAWFLETDTWPWRFSVDSVTGAVKAAH